jgi:hypothetical protein
MTSSTVIITHIYGDLQKIAFLTAKIPKREEKIVKIA